MSSGWVFCDDHLPVEGQLVETRSPSGMVSQLMRRGRLWFVADGSMYVYYTPVAWREL